jgi:DNA adenine methylase
MVALEMATEERVQGETPRNRLPAPVPFRSCRLGQLSFAMANFSGATIRVLDTVSGAYWRRHRRRHLSVSLDRPVLRWVGGKRLLTTRLLPFLPPDVKERTYYEPFLGAASLFLAIGPTRARLSDRNAHLMDCYSYLKSHCKTVAAHLRKLAAADTAAHYYRIRAIYNSSKPSAAQAARFIYLNQTSFNGVFRVNRAGSYNVPYGYKKRPHFPTTAELTAVSLSLRRARLLSADFSSALRTAAKGDFVYLDPPYPPLNGTAYFTHYTSDRFSLAEQFRLSQIVSELDKRGCLIMMTNADTSMVRRLYRRFFITQMTVARYVTCNEKHRVHELIITNYKPSDSEQ